MDIKYFVIIYVISMVLISVNCDKCNCKPLKQCPTFMTYLRSLEKPLKQETIDFVRSQKCGFQNGFPKVCCLNTYSRAQSRNKLSKKTCDSTSECKILKDCIPIMNLISPMRKPLRPAVVEFLRDQQCGFEMGFPKVCCSQNTRFFRRYRPKSRVYLNVLSAQEEPKSDEELFQLIISEKPEIESTTTMKTTTERVVKNEERNRRIDEYRRKLELMQFLDFDDFDLVLRKKRSDTRTLLNVEIR